MAVHVGKESNRTIRRVRKGNGFHFHKKGRPVSEKTLSRISKLSIPPAWVEVIISADPKDYIQAIGIDSKGRKQYVYHPEWIKKNQEHKFDQMVAFGERLPTLRGVMKVHMRDSSLSRNRLLATVIWLLENTFIRVGNKTYAKENESYGLTTMRNKHVDIKGGRVTFSFKGKSGVDHELDVTHPTIVKTIKEVIELPGYEIFQYVDEDGERHVVDSSDVNEYLQTHTGADFSAKDFRTWGGSVLAGDYLYQKGGAENEKDLKTHIGETVQEVANHLGNTKKVCRTYYIHPAVIRSYEDGVLIPHFERVYKKKPSKKLRLSPEEYATWSLIKDS